MDLSNEQIANVLEKYKRKLEYDRNRYHNVKKLDTSFIEKNRERARNHYQNNKDKKKEYYQSNQEKNKLINQYYYYKRLNKLDVLESKYPDKYKKLCEMGKITPVPVPVSV